MATSILPPATQRHSTARPDVGRRSSSTIGGAFKSVGKYLKEQSVNPSGISLQPQVRRPTVHHVTHQSFRDVSPRTSKHKEGDVDMLVQDLTALCPVNQLSMRRRELEQRQRYAGAGGYAVYMRPPESHQLKSPYLSMPSKSNIGGQGCFQNMVRQRYGTDHVLQTYDLLVPDRPVVEDMKADEQFFVVHIHGGYFRDPKIDSASFTPAIALIEEGSTTSCPSLSPYPSKKTEYISSSFETDRGKEEVPANVSATLRGRIAGYASINYRLSPHPGHEQCSQITPAALMNEAMWPEQPNDIIQALKHMQQEHPATHQYVLMGHSVGATLAFVAAIQASEHDIVPPRALIGVSGIYDFPLLHQTHPEYESLTSNAIARSNFVRASPARHVTADWAFQNRSETSNSRQQIVLAHSREDELVDSGQATRMEDVLAMSQPAAFDVTMVKLCGGHNEPWSRGIGLVRVINACFKGIDRAACKNIEDDDSC